MSTILSFDETTSRETGLSLLRTPAPGIAL